MRVPNDEEDVCPICLDPPAWTCRTNCGHSYCTDCISAYINAAGYAHGLTTSCPCCRQRLTLLVPFFTAQEIANQHERGTFYSFCSFSCSMLRLRNYSTLISTDNHQTLINIFNRRQNSTWIDTIRDAPVLVGYLFSLLTSPNMLGFAFLFRLAIQILALVLYILSPLDIIPEAVFGPLGFLDDILVIFSVIIFWSSLLRRQILRG